MELYSLNEDKSSIFNLDVRIIALTPYLLLVLYRLINSLIFVLNINNLMIYSGLDILAAYLATFVSKYDLLICILPVVFIIFEKKSKLVKFHSFQYLILNIFIPMAYIFIVLVVFIIMGIMQLSWTVTLLYLYFMMMLYGMWSIISTVLQVIAIYNAYSKKTSCFIIISNITNKLAKI